MTASTQLLNFTGCISFDVIDDLLKNLKKKKEFASLGKAVSGRIYAITVECLENIAKHSEICRKERKKILPYISVTLKNGNIAVKAGNPMSAEKIPGLETSLRHINSLDETELLALYESRINHHESSGNGAGLGFMLMKLKSRNNIEYSFSEAAGELVFFEVMISVNSNIMRKLIIERTSSSPKVIFDPDGNRFEISGESRPPDVAGFYGEILNWFDDYSVLLLKSHKEKEMIVNLDFDYFNSSSAKYILDFCKKVASLRSGGMNACVNWHYELDDIDMLESGREMSKMARFPFEFIAKGRD